MPVVTFVEGAPDNSIVYPRGISADGCTVWGDTSSSGGPNRGFIWSKTQGFLTVPSASDPVDFRLYAMSANGRFVVGVRLFEDGGSVAAVWTKDGGLVHLKTPAGGSTIAPLAVSDEGTLIAGKSLINGIFQPVLWPNQDAPVVLPTLPGAIGGAVNSITPDGQILAGVAYFRDATRFPLLWRLAADGVTFKPMPLAILPSGESAFATSVSANGKVVIGNGKVAQRPVGLKWDVSDPEASTFPCQLIEGMDSVSGISADNAVVLGTQPYSYDVPPGSLWSEGQPIVRFWPLMTGLGIDIGNNGYFWPVAMSADASTFVVRGYIGDIAQAWVISNLPKLGGGACPADLNTDFRVDDNDFLIFVGAYAIGGCTLSDVPTRCDADFDQDGVVDDSDFEVFVLAYDQFFCR